MPFEFMDRVSGQPGRVRIVPENGAAPYYATVERADMPTVAGTPLNAATLNAAQESLVYQDDASVHTLKRVYLAIDGNDSSTGETAAEPMATVKGAIRKYAKWHKYLDLYLADGTYTETIGSISTDNCSLSIRSTSMDKDAVTIRMDGMLETHLNQLRLYNLTLNMTASETRVLSVNAGELYAYNVRFEMPAASSAACINVYNGASLFLSTCVINAGTGAAVYGNQALQMRAYNCTSERKVALAFYANNGSLIEYSPTMNATQMVRESNGGKCIELAARPGMVEGDMGALYGRYRTYDGLLLQWGSVSITPTAANVGTSQVLTFGIKYAATPLVYTQVLSSVPENCSVGVFRHTVDDPTAQVEIVLTRTGTTTTVINWFAIGKGAT